MNLIDAKSFNDISGLVNSKNHKVATVKLHPKVAKYICENLNKNNRTIRQSHIEDLKKHMTAGSWILSGQQIKFSTDGILLDGQHRLAACVQVNKPVIFEMCFGLSPESFLVMDNGKKRSAGDAFHVAGVANCNYAAAAVRWYDIIHSSNPETQKSKTYVNADLYDIYKTLDATALNTAIRNALSVYTVSGKLVIPGQLAAVFYIYMHDLNHSTEMSAFIKDVQIPKGAAKLMLNHIRDMASYNAGRVHEISKLVSLITTLNSYVSGNRIAKKDFNWSKGDPIPNII